MSGLRSIYFHDGGDPCPICGDASAHQHDVGAAQARLDPEVPVSSSQPGIDTAPTDARELEDASPPSRRTGRVLLRVLGVLAVVAILAAAVAHLVLGVRPVLGSELSADIASRFDKWFLRPFTVYCPSAVLAEGRYVDCTLTDRDNGEELGIVRAQVEKGKRTLALVEDKTRPSSRSSSAPAQTQPAPQPAPETLEPSQDPAVTVDPVDMQVEIMFTSMQSKEVFCNSFLRNPSGVWDLMKANVRANSIYDQVTLSGMEEYMTPLCDEYLEDLYSR